MTAKKQGAQASASAPSGASPAERAQWLREELERYSYPVSYTHLTLPTNREV